MVGNPNIRDPEKSPANKPIVAEGRFFKSQKLAAEELGLHRNTIAKRVKRGDPGYHYVEKRP